MDISAALSLVSKVCQEREMHSEMQRLWLQQAVREQRLNANIVNTVVYPSDLLRESLSAERREKLMRNVDIVNRKNA